MANRWETMEIVTDFILGGSKITADGDCSHEIKRLFFLGRKVMTNLNNILKSKDITLSTTVCLVKAMVFPVVMYGCESWTIKKAKHQRIDAFELWCWRRLLRVPWTAGRSNQSILKDTDVEVETPILWPPAAKNWLHLKRPWCWERLKAEGEGNDRGWDGWMASPTLWTWVWVNSGSWWWTGRLGMLQSMASQLVTTKWLNWTELKCKVQRCNPDLHDSKDHAPFTVKQEVSVTCLYYGYFLFRGKRGHCTSDTCDLSNIF